MKQKGFTLIELMITLVVMGILLSTVVGMATSYIANARLRTTADELRIGLMTAKMEAIKRNTSIDFVPDSNGGWQISIPASYTDNNTKVNLQFKTVNTNSLSLIAKDTANVAVTSIRFTGSGRPDKDVTFSLFPTVANPDVTNLNVLLTSGGQLKVCNPNVATVYGC